MLRPSHSFFPPAAMFCLCCANNFLHNQIALEVGTQRERERGAKEGGEGEHTVSLYFIYISSPMKAGVPM